MSGHIPVLLDEVVEALAPKAGESFIDGTFGAGGYARAILDSADCRVTGIDRDPDAVLRGRALEKEYAPRFVMVEGVFSEMEQLVDGKQDGVVLDLGVSSFQFDQGDRGFSFREDGPLDMRMSRSGMSAADFVNTADEETLANVIFRYGEERQSRRIARAIIASRPVTRTAELADIVSKALGPAARAMKIHPATRTFQALRIHVNDELGELERGLEAAERVLKPKGRLAVVSFHSLEDRIVKRFFADRSGKTATGSRHAPVAAASAPTFRLLDKPQTAANDETQRNPRSRSARLRVGERTAA